MPRNSQDDERQRKEEMEQWQLWAERWSRYLDRASHFGPHDAPLSQRLRWFAVFLIVCVMLIFLPELLSIMRR